MAYYQIESKDGTVTKVIANHEKMARGIVFQITNSEAKKVTEINHLKFHGKKVNNDLHGVYLRRRTKESKK